MFPVLATSEILQGILYEILLPIPYLQFSSEDSLKKKSSMDTFGYFPNGLVQKIFENFAHKMIQGIPSDILLEISP